MKSTASSAPAASPAATPAGDAPDAALPAPTPGGAGNLPAKPFFQALTRFIETQFEDVGSGFADEARKVDNGEAEARNIRGTTTPEEEAELREEGVEFLFNLQPIEVVEYFGQACGVKVIRTELGEHGSRQADHASDQQAEDPLSFGYSVQHGSFGTYTRGAGGSLSNRLDSALGRALDGALVLGV